jgi:hypothetical protein
MIAYMPACISRRVVMTTISLRFCLVLLLALAAACTQPNSADPVAPPVGATDTNRFWVFPNPGRDPATGIYVTNDASYAQAYYDAIDPLDERATLAGFKTKNGFGTTVAGVSEVNVIFRDAKDLGYGRKMTVRFTTAGYPGWPGTHWVTAFVENYQVVPFATVNYSSLNLEAAITGNQNYHVGTNAIEYTIAPDGRKFAKFYTYAPGSGTRLTTVNLDGRGQKAMPSVCVNCHGGRADPLLTFGASVAGGSFTSFPNGGYTKARMQPIDVGTVEFWNTAPYRRIDQEEALRQINHALFCTHTLPLGAAPVSPDPDVCRPTAIQGHDYQGVAADMMKDWYAAGGGINNPTAIQVDTYIPAGWAGQEPLYLNVVKPYCRVCHQLRGTENLPQDDIDFTSYAKFQSYADRIKHHVYDRGNMPLGLLIYNQFWETGAPEQLADWLASVNVSYNPVRVGGGPTGRPVQPSGLLTDPAFLATGTHNTTNYIGYPANTTFATIKSIIQNTNTVGCTGCHAGSAGTGGIGMPPISYDSIDDRNGDGVVNVNDDHEFYRALRGRANLIDFLASPLLRKPTGNHHGGGAVLDPTNTTACNAVGGGWPECQPYANYGAYSTAVYNTFLDWIQHGAPYSYTGTAPNY